MSRKKKNRDEEEEKEPRRSKAKEKWHADLLPETKRSVLAVLFFVLAAVFALSFIGKGGALGGFIYRVFGFLLGRGYFFAPLSFVLVAFSLLFSEGGKIIAPVVLGGTLFLLSVLSLLEVVFGRDTGGVLGSLTGGTMFKLFDFWAALIISAGFLIISLLLMLNKPLRRLAQEKPSKDLEEEDSVQGLEHEGLMANLKGTLEDLNNSIKSAFEKRQAGGDNITTLAASAQAVTAAVREISAAEDEKNEALISVRKLAKKFDYQKPPLELLQGDKGTPSSGDIRANANVIKRTLENFGIDVEMGEVAIGPTLTQYTLRPAEGVKLSKITALHNDLSLALAAHPIRIEAPIPGKPLVGVEVPNRSVALVGLRNLIENKVFREATSPLLLALGRDVAGTPVYADLARMPHLLIGGATGSGKSVAIHTMMASFLYRNPPEVLRFIIIDPKRVELTVYNDIPHLLTPVITEAKKTVQALRWAAKEMDRRYDLLSLHRARDIAGFNAKMSKSGEEEILPYIVIIIDELADLMATFPREVEASIIRLAQMARAVGIHLVVATQRPSVEVITGLIKANITSRMAMQVASQVDSRTILDTSGAEKLLGNGDMLFMAGDTAKPRRIQGAFISEPEVKRVVDFLREGGEAPEYEHEEEILKTNIEEMESSDNSIEADEDDDPMYEDARVVVVDAGRASASYLQRRLRVGYARAARLIDMLEKNGVVGPADGAKPREVLIKNDIQNSEISEI